MSLPDLNLLRVFDFLYEERSVSRAAVRLNVTQSAVSHALRRLRAMVGDPLFTRGASGLQSTARADELAPRAREILVQVRTALNTPSFDPGTSSRLFTIAAGSYLCRLVIPTLVANVRSVAPEIALQIRNVDQALLHKLDQGTVDIALGSFDEVPARVEVSHLFYDSLIWVSSLRHPFAGQTPSDAELARQPRLAIAADYPFRASGSDGRGEGINRLLGFGDGRALEDDGDDIGESAQGRVSFPARVYDAETALSIISRTDLIAVLPRRIALLRAAELKLHLFPVSASAPLMEINMLRHHRFAGDPALAWLCEMIVSACASSS